MNAVDGDILQKNVIWLVFSGEEEKEISKENPCSIYVTHTVE